MKIKKSERDLLIGLLGILIFVAAWFLYISPTMDETDSLKAKNVELRTKAEEYQAIDLRKEEFAKDRINYDLLRGEIEDRFPAEVRTEDQLMFWASIDNAYPFDLAFKAIDMEERDIVAVAGVENLEGSNIIYQDGGSPQISDTEAADLAAKYKLCGAPTAMNFLSTYSGMKKMFDYINMQYNENAILSFQVMYREEDGLLEGNVAMELYYIEGMDKEYSAPFIPSVPKGQSNLFHSIDGDGSAMANGTITLADYAGEDGE